MRERLLDTAKALDKAHFTVLADLVRKTAEHGTEADCEELASILDKT